ncbi:MAG: copper amine oxidase N-terminal domain-containing protein [Clostridia bacterium]|nr:copper amine oxidase N-terminal domain-containing protein [Clostridia bacterium]
MKKSLFFLSLFLIALCLCLGALAADTVYISDNGTGNGETAETPTASLADAITAVKGGGKIVITDTYTLSESFFEPAHDGNITITGGKLIFNHPQYSRYYMSGPLTFEKTSFAYGTNNGVKSYMILARFHDITLGTGMSTTGTVFIVGGYQYPLVPEDGQPPTNLDSHIHVMSGTYNSVIGFCRGQGATTYRGTSHITVDGGTIKNLYGASVNGQYSGSTEIVVNGGSVGALFTGGDKTRRLNGDAKITVNGGSITSISINNVMGHADLYYLGGKIGSVSKSVEEDIANKVTDGTSTMIVRKGQIANEFIDAFDVATYEDGTKVSAAADAAVAQYTLLDKTPTESHATAARVYVSNAGSGDGLSPQSPISDLAAAIEMLDDVDVGTIVLINKVGIETNFMGPNHDNKIIITSYDGEQYFDGGLDTGTSHRVYLRGDTLIENTRLTFTKSLLFVCNYNNVTFGAGLDMPEIDPSNANCTVVLGHQIAKGQSDPMQTNVHAEMNIYSGNFYAVIAYNRGSAIAGETYFYDGKTTVNVYGGKIYRLYGGTVQAYASNESELNICGGEITDQIFTGCDQFYAHNTSTVNITGGRIKTLNLQNVIKSTTVNWTGGTIDETILTYGKNNDGSIDIAPLAEGATYTLNYAGVTPSAEMLALFGTVNSGVAPQGQTIVKLTIGSNTAYVNGEAKTLDVAPLIENSRTLMPLRFIAESLGATVEWDGATSTATLTTADVTLLITLGQTTAYVNGQAKTLDVPAESRNGRTLLPVRFIAESFGAEVAWDGATSTATLTK